MKQIKWKAKKEGSGCKHFVGTGHYLAYVAEYVNGECRAEVNLPTEPECATFKWFYDIDEAKEWAMSNLTNHAKSAITKAIKSIAAAQAFLGLVEGQEGANE